MSVEVGLTDSCSQENEDEEEEEGENPVSDILNQEIARRVEIFKEKLIKEYEERE